MRHALASLPPLNPRRSVRRQSLRPHRQRARHPHRTTIAETATRLSVNVVIACAAIASLVRLVPYNIAQQSKLQSLNAEVQGLERQVETLQGDFVRYFDPQQARSVMREESSRVDAGQRRIVWRDIDDDRGSSFAP